MNRNLFAFKLFFILIVISGAALAGGFILATKYLNSAVDRQEISNAKFTADIFASDLSNRLNFLKNETIAMANNPQARKLAADFADTYEKLGLDAETLLGKKYVEGFTVEAAKPEIIKPEEAKPETPPAEGEKAPETQPAAPAEAAPAISPEAEAAAEPMMNLYDSLDKLYSPVFNELVKNMGLEDIIIIDSKGNVIYSHNKGKEFATNLVNGKWQDSSLAKLFIDARSAEPETAILYDSKPYEPAGKGNSALLASPIRDNGVLLGLAVFRFTFDPYVKSIDYQKIFKEQENIYVISSDGGIAYSLAASPAADLKNINQATPENPIVKISAVDKRIFGKKTVEALSNKWQVVSEFNLNARERDSLTATRQDMLTKFLIGGAIAFVLSLILAILLSRTVPDNTLRSLSVTPEWTVKDVPNRNQINNP